MIYTIGEGEGNSEPALSSKSTISQTELHAHYCFKRESILFITNLVAGDITHNTQQNHTLSPLHQVLIALQF